jgi:hypothetical protein
VDGCGSNLRSWAAPFDGARTHLVPGIRFAPHLMMASILHDKETDRDPQSFLGLVVRPHYLTHLRCQDTSLAPLSSASATVLVLRLTTATNKLDQDPSNPPFPPW